MHNCPKGSGQAKHNSRQWTSAKGRALASALLQRNRQSAQEGKPCAAREVWQPATPTAVHRAPHAAPEIKDHPFDPRERFRAGRSPSHTFCGRGHVIAFTTAASGQLRSSRSPMRSGRIGSRISLISPSVSDGTRLG
jgi:hypothetical protein